jgi:DNA-binding GntR family transcriptional regulator
VAADEHRRLLDCGLARDWRSAQRTLVTHVQDCVGHIVAKGLVASTS